MEDVAQAAAPKTKSEFEPLVVLEFAVNTKQAAIEWMIAKLQAPSDKNGADLCVTAMVMQHNQVQKHLLYMTLDVWVDISLSRKDIYW